MGERVILIHGLWLRGLTLGALGRRLRSAGYATVLHDYASVFAGPEPAIDSLLARLRREPDRRTHLVGHSLGGLVALSALARDPQATLGRIVCLGSPLAGSSAARGLGRLPVLPALVGRCRALLDEGVGVRGGAHEVGMIAGTRALGVGRVFGGFQGPSDGTVALSETQVPGLADHCTVHTSHVGLILSAVAARRVVEFLQNGRFRRDGEGDGERNEGGRAAAS